MRSRQKADNEEERQSMGPGWPGKWENPGGAQNRRSLMAGQRPTRIRPHGRVAGAGAMVKKGLATPGGQLTVTRPVEEPKVETSRRRARVMQRIQRVKVELTA